jgi:hypothetical protein
MMVPEERFSTDQSAEPGPRGAGRNPFLPTNMGVGWAYVVTEVVGLVTAQLAGERVLEPQTCYEMLRNATSKAKTRAPRDGYNNCEYDHPHSSFWRLVDPSLTAS